MLLLLIKVYVPVQIILLPLVIMNGYYRRKYDNFKTLWIIHRALLVMAITIPLIVLVKPVNILKIKQAMPIVSKPEVIITKNISDDEIIIKNSPIIPFVLENRVQYPHSGHIFNLNWKFISLLLLSIGILNFLISILKDRALINRIKRDAESSKLGSVSVYTSPYILSSFSFGVFKPGIYLSDGLDSINRDIIITHELNHIQSGHLLWLNLEVACKKLFWFNPVYYMLYKEGEILRELLCDLKSVEKVDVRDYGKALVTAAANNFSSPKLSCAGWGQNSGLKLRIEKLLSTKNKIPGKLSRGLLISISAAIFLILILFPVNVFAVDNTIKMVGELNTVPESLFKEFLKESEKHGAFLASQNFNMREVIMSLPELERENIPWASPVKKYRRTLAFGMQIDYLAIHKDTIENAEFFHLGNDMAYSRNSPIYAPGNGEVVWVDYQKNGYGNVILLKHSYGFYTLYAHLDKVIVASGDNIKKGTQIGKMGSTGRSTGPHLHYEVYQGKRPDLLVKNHPTNTRSIQYNKEIPEYMYSILNSFDFIPEEESIDKKNYKLIPNGDKYGVIKIE